MAAAWPIAPSGMKLASAWSVFLGQLRMAFRTWVVTFVMIPTSGSACPETSSISRYVESSGLDMMSRTSSSVIALQVSLIAGQASALVKST